MLVTTILLCGAEKKKRLSQTQSHVSNSIINDDNNNYKASQ